MLLGKQLYSRLSLSFFIVYLGVKAAGFCCEWLLVHPDSPFKALWLGAYMALSFLMAPCLWLLAIETSTNRRPKLNQLSITEKAIIVIGILLTLPLMLAAHPGKFMADPQHPAVGITAGMIHETMLLSIGLFLFQVPWYLYKSLQIVRKHKKSDFDLFSNTDDMPLNTLKVLIWVMLGNWILGFLRTLRELLFDGPSQFNVILTCLEAGITFWAVYVILKRLLPLPLQQISSNQNEIQITINNPDDATEKYARSPLDDAIRERIAKKLRHALEVNQLFKQSNLKLRDLCDHIKESTHYVSQVINQSMETSFYELINQYRIEAAKKILLNNTKGNVIDIAMDVGFNSKSTFNLAFKRLTGHTPKEYKALNS